MLYLVTESSKNIEKILNISIDAIHLGVDFLQIRNKSISKSDFIDLSQEIIRHKMNTKIIINDYVDIASELQADGAHIGQNDMDPIAAKKILGDKILGLSVENTQQAKQANKLDLNYIAVSPLFATKSKIDTAPPCGLQSLSTIKAISNHPVFAIGGINENNAEQVFGAGADGICVVSEIYSIINHKEKITSLQKICNLNI